MLGFQNPFSQRVQTVDDHGRQSRRHVIHVAIIFPLNDVYQRTNLVRHCEFVVPSGFSAELHLSWRGNGQWVKNDDGEVLDRVQMEYEKTKNCLNGVKPGHPDRDENMSDDEHFLLSVLPMFSALPVDKKLKARIAFETSLLNIAYPGSSATDNSPQVEQQNQCSSSISPSTKGEQIDCPSKNIQRSVLWLRDRRNNDCYKVDCYCLKV